MQNKIFFLNKKIFYLFIVIIFLLFIVHSFNNHLNIFSKTAAEGDSDISICSANDYCSKTELISLSSTGEPTIKIASNEKSGKAQIFLYKVDTETFLNSFIYNDDHERINKKLNTSNLNLITSFEQEISKGTDNASLVSLPLDNTGIWYLEIKFDNKLETTLITKSKTGVVLKEGNNEFIFWGQDFETRRSINEGNVNLYNLQNKVKKIGNTIFDNDGIAKIKLNPEADVAVIDSDDGLTVIPINLQYSGRFEEKKQDIKSFVFTDRPLYRPGDTIYFKAILRNDDAEYSIPSDKVSVVIKTYKYGNNIEIYKNNHTISQKGTISGEYILPENAPVGEYYLSLQDTGDDDNSNYSQSYFNVEYYRKPEYSLNITLPKNEAINKEIIPIKIDGRYFFGQPLANKKIKYKAYINDFYDYKTLEDKSYILDDLDNYLYGHWKGDKILTEKEITLNQYGEKIINLPIEIPPDKKGIQILTVEAEYQDISGNPVLSSKKMLVHPGEFSIYRTDKKYQMQIDKKFTLPITLVPQKNTEISNVSLTAKIHYEKWTAYHKNGEKNLSYKKEEKDLDELKSETDKDGNTTFNFTPLESGSYTITVEGKDKQNNTITKTFHYYALSKNQATYYSEENNELTIKTDKTEYNPSDTVLLSINSNIPNRDVLLSFERQGVKKFQIIHLNEYTAEISAPLTSTDMPNIFASVSSFSDNKLESDTTNIDVSTESKKLKVDLTTDEIRYGPGESVTVKVKTTDNNDNPVSADLALWSTDKAIFELMDQAPERIFNTFWSERYNSTTTSNSLQSIVEANGMGCFSANTLILMSDKTLKRIKDIKIGDTILTRVNEFNSKLVKTKVLNVHRQKVPGHLIINKGLKITDNHYIWVNNSWKKAGDIQINDILIDKDGKAVTVTSIEWLKGEFEVYNLEIEKYHTFFADGVWVHNDKGGGAPRSVFKDTAYWNSSVHTDASGKGQVTFQLPDNLTTWIISAIGSTANTQVGQSTNEIIVTKDIIIRPILPNILRNGDEITISALVMNSTDKDQNFEVKLDFDSGEIKSNSVYSEIFIKANEFKQIDWKVLPQKENNKAKLAFSAHSKEDDNFSDTIISEIPVRVFGFIENNTETGIGEKTYKLKLNDDIDKAKSNITLSLSPSIVGMLPNAMEYLIDYPYGCSEQITSQLAPAISVKENPILFSSISDKKNIDKIIKQSINKLSYLQQKDGTWLWWHSGDTNLFLTSYIIENLVAAKKLGYQVEEGILTATKSHLEKETYYTSIDEEKKYSNEQNISRLYNLSLLGSEKNKAKIENFDNLSADLLAMAIMINVKNGEKNPQLNGLDKLISQAISVGDQIYWEEGAKENFGSKDASTALAIRAILAANGDREIAVKAANYLVRNRNKQYWSNTFATSQVVRALTDLYHTDQESKPNFTYTVLLNKTEIAHGEVIKPNQIIKDIEIPLSEIKAKESNLTIEYSGQGQLYSTLFSNQFNTNKNLTAENHGLKIERKYINQETNKESLRIGDVVKVELTVSGLQMKDNYVIIKDELPSGFIPIHPEFKNIDYSKYGSNYGDYSKISNLEITENGIIIALNEIGQDKYKYSYYARVVNEGTFYIPPATVSLMYNSEINGHTEVQTISIPRIAEEKRTYSIFYIVLVISIIISLSIIIKKKKLKKIINKFLLHKSK